jgi:hypothetical protein
MWDGEERRSGDDRRVLERRRSVRYSARNLIILDGITWVDSEGTDRRRNVRRSEDRQILAAKILKGLF